jgi:hypothetical protein
MATPEQEARLEEALHRLHELMQQVRDLRDKVGQAAQAALLIRNAGG